MADEENTNPSAEPAEEATKASKKTSKKKAVKQKAVKKKTVKKKTVKNTSATEEEAVKEKLEEKIKAAAAANTTTKSAVSAGPASRREEKDSLGMLALLSIALLVFVGVWALYSYLSGEESGLLPDEQATTTEPAVPAASGEADTVIVEEVVTIEEVAPAPEAETTAPESTKGGFFDRLFGGRDESEAPAVAEQPASVDAPSEPETAAVQSAPAPAEAVAPETATEEAADVSESAGTEESGSFIGNLMDKFIHSEEQKPAPEQQAAETASTGQEAAQPATQAEMPAVPAPYGPPPGYGYPPRPYGAPYGGPAPYGRPAPYGAPAPYGPPPGFFDDRRDMMMPPPMPYSGYDEPAPVE